MQSQPSADLYLSRYRQKDLETGMTSMDTLNFNPAVVLLHNLLDDSQSQACAIAARGEKRIENSVHLLRRDAGAIVGDAGQQVGRFPYQFPAGAQCEFPLVIHGLNGVETDVDKNLLHSNGIQGDSGQLFCVVLPDLDLLLSQTTLNGQKRIIQNLVQ